MQSLYIVLNILEIIYYMCNASLTAANLMEIFDIPAAMPASFVL